MKNGRPRMVDMLYFVIMCIVAFSCLFAVVKTGLLIFDKEEKTKADEYDLKRYPEDEEKTLSEDFFFKYKIVVPDEKTKKELMTAFKHIHDSSIDTDYVMVNQLCHEYLECRNIVVESDV